MKINVGCGNRRLPGYVGVDAVARPAADHVAPADKLPFADASADEVLAVHVVEHVYEWEVPSLLQEWARVLRPGGALVLELPDLRKAAANLVQGRTLGRHPDQAHLWAIYGDPTTRDPYMIHRSGWWFDRLRPLVEAAGFKDCVERATVFHPVGRHVRDFRLEARRS